MEKRKKFLFFGMLILGIGGLVAFSPTIYAIVEPHITINMDPGQATNPFQIKDDQGTKVYSIIPDGSISSANYEDIFVKQESAVHLDGPAGDTESNPVILAKWQLTKNVGITDSLKTLPYTVLTGTGVRTAGTGGVSCSLLSSVDGVTWNTRGSNVSFSTASFTYKFDQTLFDTMDTSDLFLAIGCFASSDTIGDVKEITFSGQLILPVGYTIQRLL